MDPYSNSIPANVSTSSESESVSTDETKAEGRHAEQVTSRDRHRLPEDDQDQQQSDRRDHEPHGGKGERADLVVCGLDDGERGPPEDHRQEDEDVSQSKGPARGAGTRGCHRTR